MHITSKGQVTIPQAIRDRLGLLPHTEVEFEIVGDSARIRKAESGQGTSQRARQAIQALKGTFDSRLSTDELMELMRGPSADAELEHKE